MCPSYPKRYILFKSSLESVETFQQNKYSLPSMSTPKWKKEKLILPDLLPLLSTHLFSVKQSFGKNKNHFPKLHSLTIVPSRSYDFKGEKSYIIIPRHAASTLKDKLNYSMVFLWFFWEVTVKLCQLTLSTKKKKIIINTKMSWPLT